jgi:ribonucleoside-diphosphate reductase subunit M1
MVGSLSSTERYFDFDKMRTIVHRMVRNLNRTIDVGFYPTPEARNSNTKHRPIGLGVQGLADVFALLNLPFESDGARDLNAKIFQNLFISALEASCEEAQRTGAPYPSYEGSPLSRGKVHCDFFDGARCDPAFADRLNAVRARIAEHGTANSLLVAPMPTASTSQIFGNFECVEPPTSNLFSRRTLSGEFVCLNKVGAAPLRPARFLFRI